MQIIKAGGPLVRVNGLTDADNLYICLFGNVKKFYSVKANYYTKNGVIIADPEIISSFCFDAKLLDVYKNMILAFAEIINNKNFLDLI